LKRSSIQWNVEHEFYLYFSTSFCNCREMRNMERDDEFMVMVSNDLNIVGKVAEIEN